MKDWKERVTSNHKLAAINASTGSHPAMPFGHRPGGERAPVAPARQKTQPQALACQYRQPLSLQPPQVQAGVRGRAQPWPP